MGFNTYKNKNQSIKRLKKLDRNKCVHFKIE